MHAAVTVHMDAEPEAVWDVIADIRNTPKFSPEVFESEWLDGATGPALGRRSGVMCGATRSARCTGPPAG